MSERMFGVESEYAIHGVTADRKAVSRDRLITQLMNLVRTRIPSLEGSHYSDRYLHNGCRLYIDCGSHPEVSSPECTNPWDIVRYVMAGERILGDICQEIEGTNPDIHEAMVFKCNVDYSGARSTWGCHESYLHRTDPALLPRQLIPHLVSRNIYCGAGGFDPCSRGLEFSLSPRASHLVRIVSHESTRYRGIFHTKDESLSEAGYHRLHLLCGESLCSETASWLKIGSTSLIVALVEAGLRPGDAVRLRQPLEALRLIAGDVQWKARVPVIPRRQMSAIEIQRHYLGEVEKHLGESFLPPWAETVCREWRAMLERLESDPRSAARTLDWAIKLELYRDHARRRGIDWDSLPIWTHVVTQLRDALTQTAYRGRDVRVEFLLGPRSPIPEAVQRLSPIVRRNSLNWGGLRPFMDLRQELFEIDMRFGQLGERGIFASLDRAGMLEHHFPGVDNIEHAVNHPPAQGRARVRGEVVGRLAGGQRPSGRCSWQSVWDMEGGRVLDLSDPFESQEHWKRESMPRKLAGSLSDLF